MAAMVILSLGIFALMSVNAMTLRQASYNENAQTAHTIATGQLALVEGILKINFRAAKSDLETDLMRSVTFPDFLYIIKDGGFVEGSGQSLRTIHVGVYWTEKGVERKHELETTFYDY